MQESKSNSKTYSKDSSKHFWEIKGKGNKNPIFNWLVIVHVKPLQKGQKMQVILDTILDGLFGPRFWMRVGSP